jgi:transposase
LGGLTPQLIVVEATGGYKQALVAECAAAGLPIVVINPRQVRAFARAVGQTAKTDAIDARVLAEFGRRVAQAPPTGPVAHDLRTHIRWLERRVADVDATSAAHHPQRDAQTVAGTRARARPPHQPGGRTPCPLARSSTELPTP